MAIRRLPITLPIVIVALLMSTIFLSSAGTAAAQGGRRFRNRPNEDRQQRLERKELRQQNKGAFGGGVQMRLWATLLKLNDEQIRRMRQIQRASAGDYLDLEANIRDKRQTLERTLFSEHYNEESVKQLAGELARLEGQRVLMRVRIQAQIRQLLTPEQVKTFNEVRFGQPENQTEELFDLKPDPSDQPEQPEPKK